MPKLQKIVKEKSLNIASELGIEIFGKCKKDHERAKLIQVSMFDVKDRHYEQCQSGFACVAPDDSVQIVTHFHTEKYIQRKNDDDPGMEIVYVPLINDVLRTGLITLPDKPEKCDKLLDIINEIEQKWKKWLYIGPEELTIFKVHIMLVVASWFLFVYKDRRIQERVGGLLGIVGTAGGGKKRWITFQRQIAYRPIYLLNTDKIPSIFRMAEPWGTPTILIDEADQKESDSESEWVKFINSRYDGTPIPRYNASTGQTEIFQSFGLTALALRRMSKDEGITSRMIKINATISPVALPEVAGSDIYEEFQSIRNRLLYMRLKYYGKLKFVGSSGLPVEQSWRGKETLTLFRILEQIDPAISENIAEISKSLTEREIQNLSQTWDGLIINEIYSFIIDESASNERRRLGYYFYQTWQDKEGNPRFSYLNLKYLADKLGTSAGDIQRSMAQFKISTYERFRPEGTGKAQRGILMFMYPEDTDRVFMRYAPGYDHELLNMVKTTQKTLSMDENLEKNSVPPDPLVPSHDISNDHNHNNNNNIYTTGTVGTNGTDCTNKNLLDPKGNPEETMGRTTGSDVPDEHKDISQGPIKRFPWKENPRRAIFNLVRWKAPESKYGALRVTEIHDMIRVTYPSITPTEIYSVCRELYDMGAFLKSEHGSYSVNPDYVPEGDLA